MTEINISPMLNSLYSSEKETPKENDGNNSYLSNNNNNSLLIESNTNYLGELNTTNNKHNITFKQSKNTKDNKNLSNTASDSNLFLNINNNIIGHNHLPTVLETLNELSNSSMINKNSQINYNDNINNNVNNNFNNNIDDIKETNNDNTKKIFNNEQKIQISENRINYNYTDNNIGSILPTASVVNNTKKSKYFFFKFRI